MCQDNKVCCCPLSTAIIICLSFTALGALCFIVALALGNHRFSIPANLQFEEVISLSFASALQFTMCIFYQTIIFNLKFNALVRFQNLYLHLHHYLFVCLYSSGSQEQVGSLFIRLIPSSAIGRGEPGSAELETKQDFIAACLLAQRVC